MSQDSPLNYQTGPPKQVQVLEFVINLVESASTRGIDIRDVVEELHSTQRSGGSVSFAHERTDGPRETKVKVQYLEFIDENGVTVDSSSPRVAMCMVIAEEPEPRLENET